MNLIGFIISGERIHSQINAKPECHFSLSRNIPFHIDIINVIFQCPGGGPVITADNHAGDTVTRCAILIFINPDSAIGPSSRPPLAEDMMVPWVSLSSLLDHGGVHGRGGPYCISLWPPQPPGTE